MRMFVALLPAIVTAVVAGFAGAALAQSFPSRPVKIIVGGLPGGGADGIARVVGTKFGELWDQPVVIENRPGAGGTLAADIVAKAPADGYTLLMANQGTLTLAPSLQKDIRYDPISDFTPVGRVVSAPYFVVVNSGVEAASYQDLIDYARTHPGKLTFGSTGDGTVGRLVIELIKSKETVDILTVPYKGAATAITDLLARRIDIMFLDIMQAQQHVRAGSLRFIAATGTKRARAAPDVPTILEQTKRGFTAEPWFGLVGPAGMPPEVLAKLTSALTQVVRMADVKQHLEQIGYEVIDETPLQFEGAIRSELEIYSAIVQRAGLRQPH